MLPATIFLPLLVDANFAGTKETLGVKEERGKAGSKLNIQLLGRKAMTNLCVLCHFSRV